MWQVVAPLPIGYPGEFATLPFDGAGMSERACGRGGPYDPPRRPSSLAVPTEVAVPGPASDCAERYLPVLTNWMHCP